MELMDAKEMMGKENQSSAFVCGHQGHMFKCCRFREMDSGKGKEGKGTPGESRVSELTACSTSPTPSPVFSLGTTSKPSLASHEQR